MSIRIITDTAADTEKSELITVVPLGITYGDTTYLDSVDISKRDFYDRLVNKKEIPLTSQPSPQQFVEEFEKVKESGDSAIVILISSALSGTVQSANIAKSMVDYDKIYIIDSMTATAGMKVLIDVAQKMINENKSEDEIVATLEELKTKVQIYVAIDTLEYLYKGGRLSAAEAGIGTFAKIKPIVEVSREGKVEVIAKTIGRKRASRQVVDLLMKNEADFDYPAYYIYSYDEGNCDKFKEEMINTIGEKVADFERIELGPTIGTHVGHGVYGIVYVRK